MLHISLNPHCSHAAHCIIGCWAISTEWTVGNIKNLPKIPQPIIGRTVFDPNSNALEPSTVALPASHKFDSAIVQKSASWRLSHQYRHHHQELLGFKCAMYTEYTQGQDFHFHWAHGNSNLPESKWWRMSFGASVRHFLMNAKTTEVVKLCCNHTLLKG